MTPLNVRLVIILFALPAVFIAGWALTYPSASDPKNIRYVLWKANLWKIDLDTATGTMIGDARRNDLVIGRTEGEIRSKFGYLAMPADTSEYLRNCYQNSPWVNKKVLFIRNSSWMVIFDHDIATDLVLVKGC
jgi:hypothetical protein